MSDLNVAICSVICLATLITHLLIRWISDTLPKKIIKRNPLCVCGHRLNFHGFGRCKISYGISDKFPKGSSCACCNFIEKKIEKTPEENEIDKLEKLLRLKR